MTFLQLVQRLAQESGATGAPSSVVGQTGEYKRLVDWTVLSWETIQSAYNDWDWLRSSYSFTTTPNQSSYAPVQAGIATRFGRWDLDFTKIYKTADGVASESLLTKLTYPEYRNQFLLGSVSATKPNTCCQLPNRSLALGPTPDAGGYTVSGDYFKSPQVLAANGDIPECPEQYHEAIVWRALMFYARYEAAAEIYADAELNFGRRFAELTQDQRTNMSQGTFA